MADLIVTQDPTNPGVLKINGPAIVNNVLPLAGLSTAGANANDTITLQGGVWTPQPQAGVETASNVGAGGQVFKQKVSVDFQFRTIVAGTGVSVTQNANDLTIALSGGVPLFTEAFVSADQVITAAGPLTLAHGMTGVPAIYFAFLKCVNGAGANGYELNDIRPIPLGASDLNNSVGLEITSDATSIFVRYGSAAGTFAVLDETTGTIASITNTDWNLIIKAYR